MRLRPCGIVNVIRIQIASVFFVPSRFPVSYPCFLFSLCAHINVSELYTFTIPLICQFPLSFPAQIINYDSPRGGVSVVTNKGETTTSFLLIKSARPSDSGHYQCNPSNAKPKSVTVHVLNGK